MYNERLKEIIEEKIDSYNIERYRRHFENNTILPIEFIKMFQYIYDNNLIDDFPYFYKKTLLFLLHNNLLYTKNKTKIKHEYSIKKRLKRLFRRKYL